MSKETEALIAAYCEASDLDRETFDAHLCVVVDSSDGTTAIIPLSLEGIEMSDVSMEGCFALAERLTGECIRLNEMTLEAMAVPREGLDLDVQFLVTAVLASVTLEHAAAFVRTRLAAPVPDKMPGLPMLGYEDDEREVEKILEKHYRGLDTEFPVTYQVFKDLYLAGPGSPLLDIRRLANIGKHSKLLHLGLWFELNRHSLSEIKGFLAAGNSDALKDDNVSHWYVETADRHLDTVSLAGQVHQAMMQIICSMDE